MVKFGRSIRCSKLMVIAIVVCYFLWLLGFSLLSVLQLATSDEFSQLRGSILDDKRLPNITIFSAPSLIGSDRTDEVVGARQEMAVRSWLTISENVDVVLFGQHPSLFDFAARVGPKVKVVSDIDFTFLGTPFFHSMISRLQASFSGIYVLVDPETILTRDLIGAVHHANKLNTDWFMVSVSANIPPSLQSSVDGEPLDYEKLKESMMQITHPSNCSRRLLIAWNKGGAPLHAGVIPPFLYGKGNHNEWLVNEVISSEFRLVIDANAVIPSFHPENSNEYHNFRKGESGNYKRTWEHAVNHYLAVVYGSVNFLVNKPLDSPIKFIKCSGHYDIINSENNIVFPVHGPDGDGLYTMYVSKSKGRLYLLSKLMLSRQQKKWNNCLERINLVNHNSGCSFVGLPKVTSTTSMPLPFPFSLESLLRIVADKDKSIVLSVAGDNYRDMLMSWVCRLRHLKITNFIVCALDPEIYRFSVLQASSAPKDISFNNCHFGTVCFQRVTKVKSRIVLKILQLGYSVLMSDVDVYWFSNPLPYLQSFGPGTLLAQSDEYNETVPINLPRRLNSGFYYAHSDPATISAIEKVVKHAAKSKLSEQPSFYDVLCGQRGIHRVGNDQCVEPRTNLSVVFLDRDRFPNGAYKRLWEKRNVRSACVKQGCVVLHNNWISGRKRKLDRQLKSRLWEYDVASRQCLQSWNKRKR